MINLRLGIVVVLLLVFAVFVTALDGSHAFADSKTPDDKKSEKDAKIEEKRRKLEEKRKEIALKFEEKNKEKLEKIDSAKNQAPKMEEKIQEFEEKKMEIIEQQLDKSEDIEERTMQVLEKMDEGEYFGQLGIGLNQTKSYRLTFDNFEASKISNSTESYSLHGYVFLNSIEEIDSEVKYEVSDCYLEINGIAFKCVFGKARSIAGIGEEKDSMILVAFLEDILTMELHTSLKMFLVSDNDLINVDSTSIEVIQSQSRIAPLWYINGTGTFMHIVDSPIPQNSTQIHSDP